VSLPARPSRRKIATMSAKVLNSMLMGESSPFAQELPKALAGMAGWREFAEGELLFHEHQQPDGFYIVRSGKVDLRIMGHLGADFRTAIYGPGAIIGLGTAVSGRPRECTAEATAQTLTNFISRNELLRNMRHSPELTLCIDCLLADEVKRTQQVILKLRNHGRSKRP